MRLGTGRQARARPAQVTSGPTTEVGHLLGWCWVAVCLCARDWARTRPPEATKGCAGHGACLWHHGAFHGACTGPLRDVQVYCFQNTPGMLFMVPSWCLHGASMVPQTRNKQKSISSIDIHFGRGPWHEAVHHPPGLLTETSLAGLPSTAPCHLQPCLPSQSYWLIALGCSIIDCNFTHQVMHVPPPSSGPWPWQHPQCLMTTG